MDLMKNYESSGVGNLEEYKVPKKTVSMIKGLYEAFKCRVIHEGKLTDSSQVTTGITQGCVLSPTLFLLVSDNVMNSHRRQKERGTMKNDKKV
jgi:hypothetical protein